MTNQPGSRSTLLPHSSSEADGNLDGLYAEVESLPGWLSYVDARVLSLASDWQRSTGTKGDMLEIGVFEGKSAIILGSLLGPEEHIEVCDIFESDALTPENREENRVSYPGLSQRSFELNYRRWHEQLPVVHRCPSASLGDRLDERR